MIQAFQDHPRTRDANSERARSAVELIEQWYATADPRGKEYWDDLEYEVLQHRFHVGNRHEGESCGT